MSDPDHSRRRTGKITVTDVRAVLESIATVYPRRRERRVDAHAPRYVQEGGPTSLVALVLVRLGFGLRVLRALEHEHPTGDILHTGVDIAESQHPALRCFERPALALLGYVQVRQEAGQAWGRVITRALRPGRLRTVRTRRRKPWLFEPDGSWAPKDHPLLGGS